MADPWLTLAVATAAAAAAAAGSLAVALAKKWRTRASASRNLARSPIHTSTFRYIYTSLFHQQVADNKQYEKEKINKNKKLTNQ